MIDEAAGEAKIRTVRSDIHGDRPVHEIRKNIIIIMPFGGRNPDAERRYQLEFKRLKYLIKNYIEVPRTKLNSRVRYRVKVGNARVGT